MCRNHRSKRTVPSIPDKRLNRLDLDPEPRGHVNDVLHQPLQLPRVFDARRHQVGHQDLLTMRTVPQNLRAPPFQCLNQAPDLGQPVARRRSDGAWLPGGVRSENLRFGPIKQLT